MEIDDADLGLVFSAQHEFGGEAVEVELVPGGKSLAVSDANKWDYVSLLTAHKMTSSIRRQTDAFLDGFQEIIPPSLVSMFTESG
jgi:hypothetical protein